MNSDDFSWFSERYDSDRIHFLENGVGVPLDDFECSPLPQDETLNLLGAGEFSARKRPELMLEIAGLLRDRGVDFQLTMAGKGYLHDEMKQKALVMELSEQVAMPGHISLPLFLEKSHLFVHTSQWEGLPRVMLEARAMCRQSITFDVKGSRDIPDAILVVDGDLRAFADAVETQGREVLRNYRTLPPVSPEMNSDYVARSIIDFLGKIMHGEN